MDWMDGWISYHGCISYFISLWFLCFFLGSVLSAYEDVRKGGRFL